MKKILVALLAILVIGIAAVYLLIPNKLTSSTRRFFAGNSNAAYRTLITEPGNWQHWLDTNNAATAATSLNNYSFTTTNRFTNYNEVIVQKKPDSPFVTRLEFFPVNKDSFFIWWQTETVTGYNPIKKIQRYFDQQSRVDLFDKVLDKFEFYVQQEDRVYGAPVDNITVIDTLLIATYLYTDTIPNNQTIDSLFKTLYKTITAKNGSIQDSGMLHVTRLSANSYKTMVGIPIKQAIEPADSQVIKRLVPGNILLMKKTGGPKTISMAEQTLQLYVTEHGLISPAIPFQKLITNRITQPDTTKWITWFYYPVY